MPSADDQDPTLWGLLAELARLRESEERLNAEVEELRESQQVLESTLEHYVNPHELSPVACLSLDRGGRVIGANRRAVSLQIAMLSRGLRAPLTPVLAAAGKLEAQGELSPAIGAPLRDLVTAISALHHGIRRVGFSRPRRAHEQASPKIQLRARERGHRRRSRAAS